MTEDTISLGKPKVLYAERYTSNSVELSMAEARAVLREAVGAPPEADVHIDRFSLPYGEYEEKVRIYWRTNVTDIRNEVEGNRD